VTRRVVRVQHADGATLRDGIAAIGEEMEVSEEFPPDIEAAARQAASNLKLPDLDRTDIPFITIDPATSMDLDQALHIERDGDGYVVYYAIADVASFVEFGGPLDQEANRRGQTLYGADSKIPLHPKVLSDDAASLLAEQVRPALLWTIKVDATGEGTDVNVERAQVRSRAKLDYVGVQDHIGNGTAPAMFALLEEVGTLRKRRETGRGGISLPLPEQQITIEGDKWSLEFRRALPVEEWSAQISLLTGMAAANLMVHAKIGILRTLPEPEQHSVDRLRHVAKALKVDWPKGQRYDAMIRGLDPAKPNHAAMVVATTTLLRGSGYVGFDGQVPEHREHSAVTSTYAHVTAPLRRLVDRYAGEICLAICAGEPVPEWVKTKLDEVPVAMQESGRRANQYENAVLNLVEAGVLRTRVGEMFAGVVVQADGEDPTRGDVVIDEPAIEASVSSLKPLPVGTEVEVRLVEADVKTRAVRFTL